MNRSLIRLPDSTSQTYSRCHSTSQTSSHRQSANAVLSVRTSDILSSIEYRELGKKNRILQTKVDHLKQALKKAHQERKKFHETHMCK